MAKFTELFKKSEDNSKLIEKRTEFIDLLEVLQDYIGNDFYDEVVDTDEKADKLANTIEDLKTKFYEYSLEESDETKANDYKVQMEEVIEKLEDFKNNK